MVGYDLRQAIIGAVSELTGCLLEQGAGGDLLTYAKASCLGDARINLFQPVAHIPDVAVDAVTDPCCLWRRNALLSYESHMALVFADHSLVLIL